MILKGLNAAIFLADNKINIKRKPIENPFSFNYKKETREDRLLYERERIQKIYEYLLEHYPETNYAEEFMNCPSTKEWLEDLPYHTEQSLKCHYLNSDKHHCNKKDRDTSCYTCCFECSNGGIKCNNACILIK